jgi:hypothetical protein
MEQQGKFLLLSLEEFTVWLDGLRLVRKIKVIQNHHTWLPDYKVFNNRNDDKHFVLLRAMERSHKERGFSEIAQNITTFPDGSIAICRNLENIPAGIKGANMNGICIEHVGNFDIGKDVMHDNHKKTIVAVNALLCEKFKIPVGTDCIVYHRWYDLNSGKRINDAEGTTKSCPGSNFFGGNTLFACEQNFIPLIEEVLLQRAQLSVLS